VKTVNGKEFEEVAANVDNEYPVDLAQLQKIVAPCLVHMLDSYYSTLVMEKLAERGVTDFVGIHDCWLVPEKVCVDGTILNGIQVLREIMIEAASEWYAGLKPTYEDLVDYLALDAEFSEFILIAQKKWQKRVLAGYTPLFLAKESN